MECFGYSPQWHSSRTPPNAAEDFKGHRLLLVEDNRANQVVARELLELAGFEVDIAEDGLQAIGMTLQGRYAAILMDVQMPQMDGIEATRQIRSRMAPQRVPIIAMTAHAMREDREKCLEAGMDDYVSKPIDHTELFGALGRWLTRKEKGPGNRHVVEQDTRPGDPPGWSPTDPPKMESISWESEAPDLPGLHVAEALQRLGIPWEVYRKVIETIPPSQGAVLQRLHQAMDVGDLENVKRCAHSMAGACANIGAHSVWRSALEIEKSVFIRSAGELRTLLESVDREFSLVCDSIAKILADTGSGFQELGVGR
jgi:CheY-like chemotaxis protein/HPt (histidine-containing phosphotransfer) domain-containing protein